MYVMLPASFVKIPLSGRYHIKGTIKPGTEGWFDGWKFGIYTLGTEFEEGVVPMYDIFETKMVVLENQKLEIDEYRDFPWLVIYVLDYLLHY